MASPDLFSSSIPDWIMRDDLLPLILLVISQACFLFSHTWNLTFSICEADACLHVYRSWQSAWRMKVLVFLTTGFLKHRSYKLYWLALVVSATQWHCFNVFSVPPSLQSLAFFSLLFSWLELRTDQMLVQFSYGQALFLVLVIAIGLGFFVVVFQFKKETLICSKPKIIS